MAPINNNLLTFSSSSLEDDDDNFLRFLFFDFLDIFLRMWFWRERHPNFPSGDQ